MHRKGLAGPINVTVTTTPGVIIGPSPNRIAIGFSLPDAGKITVSPLPGVTAEQGFQLEPGRGELIIDEDEWGDLPQKEWSAVAELPVGDVVDEWTQLNSAVNANVDATEPAVAGETHFVTSISGSFSAATTGRSLELVDGVAVIQRYRLTFSLVVVYNRPIELTTGNAAIGRLLAGGVGVTGHVNLAGFTREAAPTSLGMLVTEIMRR